MTICGASAGVNTARLRKTSWVVGLSSVQPPRPGPDSSGGAGEDRWIIGWEQPPKPTSLWLVIETGKCPLVRNHGTGVSAEPKRHPAVH